MPIYNLNNQRYNIPDDVVNDFERDNPDATIAYMADGDIYDIPVRKRDKFLKKFPKAMLYDDKQPQPKGEIVNNTVSGGVGTQEEADAIFDENVKRLQQQKMSANVKQHTDSEGKLKVGKPGFKQDEADALYQVSPTSLRDRLAESGGEYGKQIARAIEEEKEDEEISKFYTDKQMDTPEDVYANYSARFTNTKKGIELGDALAKRTKEIQDRYVKEYLDSDNYKELASQYQGEELNKQANEQFGMLYGDAINEEILPYQKAYNDEWQRRYSNRIKRELERINKVEAGTHTKELVASLDAELNDVEERIDKRKKATRNDNWKPGMPSSRNDTKLAELRGERSTLEAAKELTDDSQKILAAVDAEKEGNFFGGLGRGIRDSAFDLDTWTMGLSDLVGGMRLRSALEKAEKGEKLTSAEERLLDAAATNMAVNYYYRNDLGWGYQSGEITGQSLPFMFEFIANPVAASGNAIAGKLLSYGLKKYAVKTIGKNATKFGTRLVGDAIAAGGVTATSGMGNVLSGAVERMNRNYQYGVDDEGKLTVTNTRETGWGEAFGKSAATNYLERQSEMIFNAFRGLPPLFKGVEASTPGGTNRFMDYISNSRVGEAWRGIKNNRTMKELAERAQFHGIKEEYLEEVYNNFANIPLGEMTIEEATDLEKNLVTFLGLAPTQLMFGVFGGISYGIERYKTRKDMARAFGQMTEEQQQKFMELQSMAKKPSNRDIAIFLTETMKDESLTQEQRRAEIEYAYNLAKQNAIDEMTDADVEDNVSQDNATIDSVTDPSTGVYTEVDRWVVDEETGVRVPQHGHIVGWIGDAPVFLPEGMENTAENRIVLKPNEWNPETVQRMPAEQVKAVNEEMTREEAARQAERESKYAPEVLNAQMQQGVPFATSSAQYIPMQPMSGGNGWVVEVHDIGEDGTVGTNGRIEEMTDEQYRDMLQAELDAAEARKKQEEEAAANTKAIVDNMKPKAMNDGTGRVLVATNVQGDEVAYDIMDANGNKIGEDVMKTDKFNEMIDHVAPEGEQLNDDGTSGENVGEGVNGGVNESQAEEPTPVGKGLFGDIYDQFKGKIKEGVNFLIKKRSGVLQGALNRKEVGDIDLVWGNTKAGLAHIITKHVINHDDFSSVDNAVSTIEDVVNNGEISIQKDGRVAFSKDGYRVAIDRNEEGNWIVTALDTSRKQKEKKRSEQDATRLHQSIFGEENGELVSPQSASLSENKDSESNVQSQEKEQKPLHEREKEDVFRELGEQYGEKMPYKVAVTAKSWADKVKKAQEKVDNAQQKLDDAPIGEDAKQKAALEKALKELADTKVQADFWAGMDAEIKDAQAKREAMLNPKVEADTSNEPMTADEFVAQQLAVGNIVLNKEDAMKETHLSNEEVNALDGGTSKLFNKNGMTIQEAGGRLMEMDRENGTNFFDQDDANAGRNALIDLLSSVKSRKELNQYIAEKHKAQAERDAEGLRSEAESSVMDAHFASLEDYVLQMEAAEVDNPFNGLDVAAKDAIFAEAEEEYQEYLKSLENGQGTTAEVIEGNSDVLSDEQADNTGGTESGQGQVDGVGERPLEEGEGTHAGQEEGATGSEVRPEIDAVIERLGTLTEGNAKQLANEFGRLFGWDSPNKAMAGAKEVLDYIVTRHFAQGQTLGVMPFLDAAREYGRLKQNPSADILAEAERIAKENERRTPLRKRAREWAKALGVKVTFIESLDDVDEETRAQIEAVHAEGGFVPGWVNDRGAFFFMPDLQDLKDVDETYVHEVVAHVGLPKVLGKERFDELCDKVWDMMPQSKKDFYEKEYPGVKEIKDETKRHRRTADEYIAFLAEGQNLTPEEKTIWDRIVKMFRDALEKMLNDIIGKSRLTDADIANLIRASYANLKAGAEGNEGEGGTRFRFSKTPQEFDAVQKEAVEKKGIVMPGLNEAVVDVLGIEKHDFKGNLKQAREEAKQWAVENYQGKEFALPEDGGSYTIGKKAINKYVDKTSIDKSDNAMIHLSALKELPNIISSSVTGEIHADYKKGENGVRSVDNGVGDNGLLVHRMFGAIELDGKVYRVKTTMNEYRDPLVSNTPHSYEVTEIELIESSSTPSLKDDSKPVNVSNNSITGTKLLNGVEKSYDKGKKLLDESEKTRFRTVYHGSGASFDKFDHSFMSTGEGNQSYGWGTYVTEVEGVGVRYANAAQRDNINWNLMDMGDRVISDERYVRDVQKELDEANAITQFENPSQKARVLYLRDKLSKKLARYEEQLAEDKAELEKWEKLANEKGGRHLYQVDIPDNDGSNYLSYKADNSQEVIDKVNNAYRNLLLQRGVEDINPDFAPFSKGVSGESIYNLFARELGNDKAASQFLNRNGFVGIAYPVNERKGGNVEGASNYVIFNESDLEIKEHTRFRVTKDKNELVAVHNISEDNLRKVLSAGGLIMPSIAITKADMGHEGYGDISLLFDRETINPSDRRNKVYGGDAWTPRFPHLDMKLNGKVVSSLGKKIYGLIDDQKIRELYHLSAELYPDNIERALSNNGVEGFYGKEWMKLAYLLDNGKKVKIPMKMKDYGDMSELIIGMAKDRGMKMSDIQQGGIDFYENNPDFVSAIHEAETKKFIASYPEEKREAAKRLIKDEMRFNHFDMLVSQATRMEYDLEHGGLQQIVDKGKLTETVNKKVKTDNAGYNKWVDGLFNGIIEKYGIRNDRDMFTPSGSSRSWEQLHDAATPANILRHMLAENERGGSGGFFDSNIMGASAESYGSIEEIREKGKERLRRLEEGEYDEWSDSIAERMSEICNDFLHPSKRNEFGASIDAKIDITNAVAKDKTAKGIYKAMKRDYPGFTMEHAKKVEEIVKEIQDSAIGYFEAKPRRIVPLNEIRKAVVPKNTSKDILDGLKDNGIEVATYKRGDEEARKRAIKRESNGIRFRVSNRNQEIFVSNAERAVEGIKQEKGTPQQWLAMIEKNGGLKAAEDKWLGLSDWLKGLDKKSVTKDEILDFINQNKIVIEEVKYIDRDYKRRLREELTAEEYDELIETVGLSDPMRINYTTEGLDNKQEIALTVPTIEPWNESDEVHFGDAGEGRAVAWVRFGETFVMEDDSYIREATELKEPYRDVNGHDIYKTDSGSNNDFIAYGKGRDGEMIYVAYVNGKQIPVAHKTLDEAKDGMNKYFKEHPIKSKKRLNVLVIDEIQSKRHQEGREKGYKSKEIADLLKETEELQDKLYNGGLTEEEYERNREIRRRLEELSPGGGGYSNIPEAPFEKNWHELAMKRMLRYAAENGYDKVAWTKGEQQADRYNLSRSIDSILCEDETISEFADGTPIAKAFVLTTSGGMDIRINADKDGMIRGGEYAGHHISDVVGKELAEKMMQPGNFTISGDGLKVGGEGMKGFYDKMLPSFVNKYVKKWGTKVQDIELPNVEEAGRFMHSVDVTDAMKESVMEGQTMFRISGKGRKIQQEVDKFASKYNTKEVVLVDSEMTDEELEAAIPGESAGDIREALKTENCMGGYLPETDKIYIFADNQPIDDVEGTMFHENAHGMFHNNVIVDAFDKASKDAFKAAREAIAEEYAEKHRAEELFAYVVQKAMDEGDFKHIEKYLAGDYKNEFYNKLRDFGYDTKEEIGRRNLGRRTGEQSQEVRTEGSDKQESNGKAVREKETDSREQAERLRHLFGQVADMGIRGVVGNADYDRLMYGIFRALPEKERGDVAIESVRMGGKVAQAVTDYLESAKDATLWEKVVGFIRDALRKAGFDVSLTENDVKYLLWRSLKPLDKGNLLDVAEDIDKKYRLKVGEYSGSPADGGGTRFRAKKKPEPIDIADKRPEIIKEYDKELKTGKFNFLEAFQDRMLSVKVLMEKIEAETGKKARSFEDAYEAENQLGSKNKIEQERWLDTFYKPLLEDLQKLSDKYGFETVRRYIYCKSGLERNEVLRQRDADAAYNEAKEELDEKLAKGDITQAQYDVLLDKAEDQRNKTLSQDVDYSGLRGMLFNVKADELFKQYKEGNITEQEYKQKVEDLEKDKANVIKDWKDFAETSVADLESRATSSEIDALWSKINAATNETLRIDFESGMIDRETYEAEKKMMKYYVPLRNWKDTTAEDMYEYRHDMTPAVTSNQQTAKGRESEADNPIATIALMAQNAIVRGNRNKMKFAFYSFVVNRPTALASVRNVWYVKDANNKWQPQYADTSAASSEAEMKQIIEQFEENMKQLEEQGDAFRGKQKIGMNFRASGKQRDEHVVAVMINGKEYAVYVNGNPRAAQAMNGLTNNEAVDDAGKWVDALKRYYGAGLTSWNPDFVIPNLVRDTIHATTMTFLDKGVIASLKYAANVPRMFSQVAKEVSGLGTGNAKLHQYFEEFVANGGETGYTAIHTLEDYKKEYDRLMNEAKGLRGTIGKGSKEVIRKISKVLEAANRITEDVNRFNAYVTSRESGAGVVESVSAAKNITVNFNRKGALNANHTVYGKVAAWMSRWILFFNPSVQGIHQLVTKTKMNPKRATAMGATILASGFLVPMLNELLVSMFGDDDDDYWNQSDYKRRNNWMLFVGNGYISIPLPPVLRELYGLGDIMYGVITGHIPAQRAVYDILKQVQSAIGFVNVIPEVSQEPDMITYVKGFAPDIVAPFMDVITNTNFMGRPIARWTSYNGSDPEYERVYKGVGTHWVELSKFMNELGGNETRRSDWWGNFINPAMMEHLFTSYTGGIGKTVNNLVGMIIDAANGDTENMDVFRKSPILHRFYTPNDEKTVVPGINRKFYDYEDQYNRAKRSLKKSIEGVNSGEHPGWQKNIDEMKKNGEYEFIQYFEAKNKELKKIQNLLKGNPSNKKELEQIEIDMKAEIAAKSFSILRGER